MIHARKSAPNSKKTHDKDKKSLALTSAEARLAKRMMAAAMTLRALPRDHFTIPNDIRSAWPNMIQETAILYTNTRCSSRVRPSPSAIDSMHAMLTLLWHVDHETRQLIWARANNIPWQVLTMRFGKSRTSLNRDYKKALAQLVVMDGQSDCPRSAR